MKFEVNKYNAPSGKLLIKPLRERKRTVTNWIPDDEKNKDKDPVKDEMELKKVTTKAPYEIQLAEVVAVPSTNDTGFNIGDTIVYSIKQAQEFDLFKGTLMVALFDLKGTYEV